MAAQSLAGAAAISLTFAAAALALGALATLVVGWFWAPSRGDWQAVVLWSYWWGTPALNALFLLVAKCSRAGGFGWRPSVLKRMNLGLLGLWVAVSLFALVLPFLA